MGIVKEKPLGYYNEEKRKGPVLFSMFLNKYT